MENSLLAKKIALSTVGGTCLCALHDGGELRGVLLHIFFPLQLVLAWGAGRGGALRFLLLGGAFFWSCTSARGARQTDCECTSYWDPNPFSKFNLSSGTF